MGGDTDGLHFPFRACGRCTLVLMDHIGKGEFKSKTSLSGTECWTTILANGDIMNLIDTPGLFDFCVGNEMLSKEMVKWIDLAKDGVDAVLLVYSLRARFTEQDAAAAESLWTFFGPKIIVLLTGGDNLEEDNLSTGPEHLQKIVELCDNRFVLFDDMTEDEEKKASQLEELYAAVDMVMETNGEGAIKHQHKNEVNALEGCAQHVLTERAMKHQQEGAMKHQQRIKEANALEGCAEQVPTELMKKIYISYDEQLKLMMETVESKLMETKQEFQQQLAEEKAVRLNAEKIARDSQEQSEYEIQELKENLGKAKKSVEEFKLHLIFFTIIIYLVLLW